MRAANLLLIMSDEHNAKMLGCAGHPFVQTPNLDNLAARGTRFTSAYTNCPICVPARASFATGRYVHRVRYWDNAMAYDGRVKGWGHRLQDARIRVEAIGKLHYRAESDPTGFDSQHIPLHITEGIGMLSGSIRDPLPDVSQRRQHSGKPGGVIVGSAAPGESAYNRYDKKIADLACDWLRHAASQSSDKPWMLYVGFVAPHFPLVVPEQYFSLYPLESLPEPKLDPVKGYACHPWVKSFAQRRARAQDATPEMVRIALAAYCGLCTYLDFQVGRILKVLEETGLVESTRVIYTSDHGENAGARGLWGKSVLYEESSRVPLIMAGPDLAGRKICATPVALVDAYQTILEAVNLRPLDEESELPGKSWFEIGSAGDDLERVVFSEYHAAGSPSGSFMIRKGRFKFHYYVGFRPELFDLNDDAEETRDLAEAPEYREVLVEYEKCLRRIVDPEAADLQAKQDQRELVARYGGPEAVLKSKIGEAGYTEVPNEILAIL